MKILSALLLFVNIIDGDSWKRDVFVVVAPSFQQNNEYVT